MADSEHVFNPKEEYAEILGKPGLRYLQNGCYFNFAQEFVKKDTSVLVGEADTKKPVIPKAKRSPGRPKKKATGLSAKIGMDVANMQEQVRKENIAADHAERLAE